MNAVEQFERALAEYCNAKFCVSASNGTVTLQAALIALGVKPGDKVATTPLTMSATSIAILNVGAVPVYCDVDPETWLMDPWQVDLESVTAIPVSLYGLHTAKLDGAPVIDDAAQTLRPHSGCAFTSLSFQSSKILSTGEGGALLTNDADLAAAARSYLSLGYDLTTSSRIDKRSIKDPNAVRHVRWPAINGRLNECTAELGLAGLRHVEGLKARRQNAAALYREAVRGCSWIKEQKTPDGGTNDHWAFAVTIEPTMTVPGEGGRRLPPIVPGVFGDANQHRWECFAQAIERHGGSRPFAAWQLSYREPALVTRSSPCPNAESLQPRIMAFTTNSLTDAERNAEAVRKAIKELE